MSRLTGSGVLSGVRPHTVPVPDQASQQKSGTDPLRIGLLQFLESVFQIFYIPLAQLRAPQLSHTGN